MKETCWRFGVLNLGFKFAHKYFESYEIIKTAKLSLRHTQYVGEHEGPLQTSMAVDYIKPWINNDDDTEDTSKDECKEKTKTSGRDDYQNGRV